MDLDFPEAFDDLMTDFVRIRAPRKESGAVRVYEGRAKACVLAGGAPDNGGSPMARQNGEHVSVLIYCKDYPGSPLAGDTLTHEGSTLTVQSGGVDGTFWRLRAVGKAYRGTL